MLGRVCAQLKVLIKSFVVILKEAFINLPTKTFNKSKKKVSKFRFENGIGVLAECFLVWEKTNLEE